MPTVRYTGTARYRAGGVTFEPGDEADIPAGLADHLVEDTNAFERAGSDEGDDSDDSNDSDEDEGDEEGNEASIPPNLASESTVSELEDAIEDIEDADAVRQILEDERDGSNRSTAIDALESRLSELED